MNAMRFKLGFGAIVFLSAITYLAAVGAKQASVYHLSVDQFLSNKQFRTQRVRLCGKVEQKNFFCSPGALTANFILQGTAVELPVQYHGVIPGLFQAGHDVIVEGQFNAQGAFTADVMMTKCASKYESGDPKTTDPPNPTSISLTSPRAP